MWLLESETPVTLTLLFERLTFLFDWGKINSTYKCAFIIYSANTTIFAPSVPGYHQLLLGNQVAILGSPLATTFQSNLASLGRQTMFQPFFLCSRINILCYIKNISREDITNPFVICKHDILPTYARIPASRSDSGPFSWKSQIQLSKLTEFVGVLYISDQSYL